MHAQLSCLNRSGKLIGKGGQSMAEIGEIGMFASGAPPFMAALAKKGWIPCDGRILSSQDPKYAALWSALNQTWGADPKDLTHTFRVPDLRGFFLRGWAPFSLSEGDQAGSRDPDSLDRDALYPNGAVGRNVGSYQGDQLKSHRHELLTQRWGGSIPHQGAEWYLGGGADHNDQTAGTGGHETRPKNAYVFYAIFSGVSNV